MHISTKKWLFQKYSSAILLPLMIWFIINLVSIFQSDYSSLIAFITAQPSSLLLSTFLIIAFFFSSMTVSEIFEDYIHNEKIKNVANKLLFIFGIIMPLITIITIFNLEI